IEGYSFVCLDLFALILYNIWGNLYFIFYYNRAHELVKKYEIYSIIYKIIDIENKNIKIKNLENKEIESLREERDNLLKQNSKLINELKNEYSGKDSVNSEDIRGLLGEEDVQGDGIILKLNLKSSLVIGQNADILKEKEIIHILNLLNFSGAQAVSINGYRITQQTGIKNASDFIWIGEEGRISSVREICIKAIGDIQTLKQGIIFPGEMEYGALINYDYEIEEKEKLTIEKSKYSLKSNYLNKSKEES
ncbi:MAG: DUF881 domain-containing protein, partial [Sarcina sp.]